MGLVGVSESCWRRDGGGGMAMAMAMASGNANARRERGLETAEGTRREGKSGGSPGNNECSNSVFCFAVLCWHLVA